MLQLIRTPVTLVWLLLMAATGLSMWVAVDHGVDGPGLATTVVMAVAIAKAGLVGLFFMELRHAPWLLRGAFYAWCAICACAVLGVYFLAT